MRDKQTLIRKLQFPLVSVLTVLVFMAATQLAGGVRNVHALPEYTTRTGESCGTCHVSAGGGGPRTLSGLLWAARGRPDQVPELGGLVASPDIVSGIEIYDIACAGCHGFLGQGLFAIQLAESGISRPAVRAFIVRGIPEIGMPAYEDKLTDAQLEALVDFTVGLASGEIDLQAEYPLPPPEIKCGQAASGTACGSE